MELLSKNQAIERIAGIDTAVVPFSVTNGTVASVLNYLLNSGQSLENRFNLSEESLQNLRQDFDLLVKSVGYPGGIAILSEQGKLPREMLPVSVFRFDGFRSMGEITPGGLLWASKGSEIFFDEAKKRFFLRTGGLLFPKDYISWGSNKEVELPASADLGPNDSSLYIYNDELYIWTGERMKRIAGFHGEGGSYDDSELRERLELLAEMIRESSGAIGDVINDTGNYDPERIYRSQRLETATRRVTDDCWHLGCRWRCLIDGTTGIVPAYGVSAWAFVAGNPEFTVDFEEKVVVYDPRQLSKFSETLTLIARLYNQDVLPFIPAGNIEWGRESYDRNGMLRAASDAAWKPKTDSGNKRLLLTASDLDYDGTPLGRVIFWARVTLNEENIRTIGVEING